MSNSIPPARRDATRGRPRPGFTLIELLLVAALLSALAAAAVPRMNRAYRSLQFRGEVHRAASMIHYAAESSIRNRAEIELEFVQGGRRLALSGGRSESVGQAPASLTELGRTITIRSEAQEIEDGKEGAVKFQPDGSRTPDLWQIRDASGREAWLRIGRSFAVLEITDHRPDDDAP